MDVHIYWIIPIVIISLFLLAYLVRSSIVNLVDNKIGEIEIKMPKINVNTKLNVSKNADGLIYITPETVESFGESKEMQPTFANQQNEKQEKQDKIESGKTIEKKVGCNIDSDCNLVNGGGKNVCKSDGTCHCASGSGTFCQFGPTNYKDPKDMTEQERKIFKYQFRNNFTLQDYKNWLMLYVNDAQHLRENHRDNLAKLLRGETLFVKDIPNIRIKPSLDAADYFSKMYEGGKISVHFPEEGETGAMLPYNYGKYSEFISPERAAKTWITGIVDLYQRPQKDDAKELNFYLRPEVTVGVERELVGEEYLNWVKKHHNLADIRKIQIRKDESINTFQSDDPKVKSPI